MHDSKAALQANIHGELLLKQQPHVGSGHAAAEQTPRAETRPTSHLPTASLPCSLPQDKAHHLTLQMSLKDCCVLVIHSTNAILRKAKLGTQPAVIEEAYMQLLLKQACMQTTALCTHIGCCQWAAE
jgi:hypothetical protein